MSHWPHYPPCVSGSCANPSCCAQGAKFTWKELRGKNGEMVKRTIEKENPNVTVVIVPQGRVGFPDFCCNRVNLYLDSSGFGINEDNYNCYTESPCEHGNRGCIDFCKRMMVSKTGKG